MRTLKAIGIIFLIIVGIFILAITGRVLKIVSLPFWKVDKQIELNKKVINKTYDDAIYNYEWFKETEGQLKSTEKQIIETKTLIDEMKDSLGSDRNKWSYDNTQEYNRLQTVLLGLKNYYHDLGGKYNARAEMVTKNLAKDNLPLFINVSAY